MLITLLNTADPTDFRLGQQYDLLVIYHFLSPPADVLWTVPPNTGGVTPGFDPIIGQDKGQPRTMTGYDADNLTKSLTIPSQFIIAQGGEYFFLPSLTLLHTLATVPNPA